MALDTESRVGGGLYAMQLEEEEEEVLGGGGLVTEGGGGEGRKGDLSFFSWTGGESTIISLIMDCNGVFGY